MADSPFIGPTYPVGSKPTSVARTVNMIPVAVETGNERQSWVFKDVAGLKLATPAGIPHDDVLLLMHFDTATPNWIEQRGRTVTVSGGTPTLDTTLFQFGPGSILNASETTNLAMPPTSLLTLGANVWTVDVWLLGFPSSAHVNTVVMLTRDGSSLYPLWQLRVADGGGNYAVTVIISSDQSDGAQELTIADTTLTRDSVPAWHHIRFGRCDATTYAVAYDGVIIATGTLTSDRTFSPDLTTGHVFVFGSPSGSGDFSYAGNVDEFCIRARAMDTANFTPPIVPFIYP